MGEQLMRNHTYAVQNGMAACVFLLLLSAESLAYLLHSFPSVEILWMLTISVNRIAGPVLSVADHLIQLPFALLAILALAVVVPIISYRCRSWLGTALSGHVALGLCVMLTFEALRRAHEGRSMASLSQVFDIAILNSSILSLFAVTLVMAVLCLLNHIVFFVRPKAL